jgi:hypothetical protein
MSMHSERLRADQTGGIWEVDANPRAFKQLDIPVSKVGRLRTGASIAFRFKGDRPERDPAQGVVTEMYRRSVFGSPLLTKIFGRPIAVVNDRTVSVSQMTDLAVDP